MYDLYRVAQKSWTLNFEGIKEVYVSTFWYQVWYRFKDTFVVYNFYIGSFRIACTVFDFSTKNRTHLRIGLWGDNAFQWDPKSSSKTMDFAESEKLGAMNHLCKPPNGICLSQRRISLSLSLSLSLQDFYLGERNSLRESFS